MKSNMLKQIAEILKLKNDLREEQKLPGRCAFLDEGHILAYHWKGEKTFSCLVKVKYLRTNFATIAIYCTAVILLSLVSGVLFEAGLRCLGLS